MESHTDSDGQKSKKFFSFHTPIEVLSNSEHFINNPLPIKSEKPTEITTTISISNMKHSDKLRSDSKSDSSFPTFITSSNTPLVVSLLVIPVLILIIISIVINLRKGGQFNCFKSYSFGRSQEKYDLGRLLGDPKKDGFNRVPIDESDGDLENSDSEVEEFNISSASAARKV